MRRTTKAASILGALLLLCTALPGCLVVGYSSQSGWWVWPGSLVLTLVLLLLFLLNRR
jgi:protein-S-isoprenylcysteine O-methyltransferase Ste14